jgi:hypothetical protein
VFHRHSSDRGEVHAYGVVNAPAPEKRKPREDGSVLSQV